MENRQIKCVIHVDSVENINAKRFTPTTWAKFRFSANQWINLDGSDRVLAEKNKDIISNDVCADDSLGFHTACYQRFTDKLRIKSAEKRCAKKGSDPQSLPSGSTSATQSIPSTAATQVKKLRSQVSFTVRKSERKTVLPPVCIICKKETSYVYGYGRKRVRDRLVQAETITAGNLLEAATLKNDENILLHIRGQDCVAIEVKYHINCFKRYTQVVIDKKNKDMPECAINLDAAQQRVYEKFCKDIVRPRLITNKEILRMKRLTSTLNTMFENGGLQQTYRNDQLKTRLKKDFPELSFHTPHKKNISEIVYVAALSADDFLQNYSSSSPTEESVDTDGSENSEQPFKQFTENPVRTLYSAGLEIKSAMNDIPGLSGPWPPTAERLTNDAAKSVIPVILFNFLAWCVGASEEPVLDNFVDVPDFVLPKLLSICQDLVSLASNGRKLTPKSLCLGLTTRHLTGSSQLLTLLNRLGHCPSRSFIISFETALAQFQLTQMKEVPPGFSKNVPTILVWDNIDFGEETLSGRGTTHHTNGIMIQNSDQYVQEIHQEEIHISKRQRTILPQPESIVPYHIGRKQGPANLSHISLDEDWCQQDVVAALNTDLAFIFSKYSQTESRIPGWTGFNVNLTGDMILPKSKIHYLPVIEATPTNMSTVNTILVRSLELANRLELKTIVLVFDQAIYAKAQQIRWKNEEMMGRFIIRLGEFHTCMSFMSILGKRFKDAGLQDILIEAEIVAQGSINGVLSGHHYNRSIRCHKLLFEVMHRLRLQAFFASLSERESELFSTHLCKLRDFYTDSLFLTLLESDEFILLRSMYAEFISAKSKECSTFAFWSTYIDMVQSLLLFVRATRESNWKLHLASIRLMMPYFFAYDRINYARYLPIYWMEMKQLQDTHSDFDVEIIAKGIWTVQRQISYSFSSIACDQAIEQTCNRDSKTAGGIIGNTLNRAAVQRWILSQPQRAAITRMCEKMTATTKVASKKELGKSRIKKEEESVKFLISTIESMINPFDGSCDGLTCLSSGVVASDVVSADLLTAKEQGESALKQYLNDRVINKTEDVFSPIKAMKLRTFSDNAKTKSSKSVSGKDKILASDRKFFGRLLVIGQSRQLDLRNVLSYSLGSVSFPLANSDGGLAKTNKAALLSILEKKSEDCEDTVLPPNERMCLLIDGMALLQSMMNIPATFGELADLLMQKIIQLATFSKCSRVDFVTDRYPSISIKNAERERRAVSGLEKIKIFRNEQKTPKQWKKYLSSGENKEALIDYLFGVWRNIDTSTINFDIEIVIAHGAECHNLKILSKQLTVVPVKALECDHEEADTRLLLHAKHAASESFKYILIRSPDTDVAVIATSLQCYIPAQLIFITGVSQKTRLINISKITQTLGENMCKALIGIHCFSGCDSTSSFYGKGKKRIFDLVEKYDSYLKLFVRFGEDFEIFDFDNYVTDIENVVCDLYGLKCGSVNEARYKLFCTKSASEKNMPPTRDALSQHILRANYQATIFKNALKQWIMPPSPVNHGWIVEGSNISFRWMTTAHAPKEILDVLRCNCKSGCTSDRCACSKSKLSCTDLCKCFNCQNEKERDVEIEKELEMVENSESDSESDNDM